VVDRPVALDIPCAVCGALAMHLESTEPGDPLWMMSGAPGDGPPATASAFGVQIEAGTHRLWLAAGEMEGGVDAVRAAMLAGDPEALRRLDPEIVPFYCRECAASYCEAHWTTWSVFDTDWPSWFDELRGICPNGHERRIYD
jgi:hypothetical protein